MKTTIFIVAGLLSAAVLCSCDKGEKPEQEQEEQTYEWEPSTKVEVPEEPIGKYDPIDNPEELFFDKEGGEQIITYSQKGWWHWPTEASGFVWYPGPSILYYFTFNQYINEVLESLGRGGIIERIEVTKAVPAAGKLIVPEGWRTKEVIGNLPTLITPLLPVGSPSPGSPDFDFIPLYEYELSTYINTEGRTPDWKGYAEFVTLIDGGWCTISREFTDWFEPYEGFAYESQTFANGITAPSKGAVGKWWMPKEFTAHPPVDYPVTVRVSPNDTGEPRQFVLRSPVSFVSAIIINQE